MDNLEEFLKADVTPEVEIDEPEAVTTEPVEAEAPSERPRGPDGKFIAKGEEPATAESASPAPQEAPLDHAALIGERRRRQEAEARIEALEKQFAQFQQPQAQPQQPQGPPDRWEDPEGYDAWLVQQAAQAAQTQAIQAVQQQRIYESAVRARGKYADYGEAHEVFGQMAQRNPALFEQMLQSADPAEFAYTQAKSEMEIRQFGGIDALVAAKVAEALKTQTPAPQAIPDTLADAQSARGSATGDGFTVPSLDDILRR